MAPGDLVTAGALAGYAAGLTETTPGKETDPSAILGKVLGTPDDNPTQLWVYVTTN